MSGHRFSGIGIRPSRSETPVGGVENGRRKGLRPAEGLRATNVPPTNLNPPGKIIENDIPLRDRDKFILDFDPQDTPATETLRQNQRDDPAPRSQVDQVIAIPEVGKMGNQQRVERKTVTPLPLDDPEAADEDSIDRFSRRIEKVRVHDHSN
jgi:hypothetical protein